jgi:hypothetical protein
VCISGENFVCSTTKAAINNNLVFVALFAASFGNEPESITISCLLYCLLHLLVMSQRARWRSWCNNTREPGNTKDDMYNSIIIHERNQNGGKVLSPGSFLLYMAPPLTNMKGNFLLAVLSVVNNKETFAGTYCL